MFIKRCLINIILYIILMASYNECGLQNYLNTDAHACVKCLCHAQTNCYSLQKCASESINYTYWEKAGAPMIRRNTNNDQQEYRDCMQDENCIINTVVGYYNDSPGVDCVCDGIADCRDMLSMHLYYGEECKPNMKPYHAIRYNVCARVNNLPLVNPNIECVDSIAI